MAIAPISTTSTPTTGSPSLQDSANSAFGLSFQSLLQIIMAQLRYQDPLKPMDNFEFVSQLAQFSQIQQGQTSNDDLAALVSAQSVSQAASLLGRTVDIPAGSTVLTGTVTAVSLSGNAPTVTIKTANGQTISSVSMSSISQVREGN